MICPPLPTRWCCSSEIIPTVWPVCVCRPPQVSVTAAAVSAGGGGGKSLQVVQGGGHPDVVVPDGTVLRLFVPSVYADVELRAAAAVRHRFVIYSSSVSPLRWSCCVSLCFWGVSARALWRPPPLSRNRASPPNSWLSKSPTPPQVIRRKDCTRVTNTPMTTLWQQGNKVYFLVTVLCHT